jgi:hypothetical protein
MVDRKLMEQEKTETTEKHFHQQGAMHPPDAREIGVMQRLPLMRYTSAAELVGRPCRIKSGVPWYNTLDKVFSLSKIYAMLFGSPRPICRQ